MKKHHLYILVACVLSLSLVLTGCGSSDPTNEGPTKAEPTEASVEEAKAEEAPKPLDLAVGETADYNGLKVTLLEAGKKSKKDYDGKKTYKIKVRYENTTDEAASFAEYDWSTENADGVRIKDTAYFMDDVETLGSGELAPGGKKEGNIYFQKPGGVVKVIYEANMFIDDEASLASWRVK